MSTEATPLTTSMSALFERLIKINQEVLGHEQAIETLAGEQRTITQEWYEAQPQGFEAGDHSYVYLYSGTAYVITLSAEPDSVHDSIHYNVDVEPMPLING